MSRSIATLKRNEFTIEKLTSDFLIYQEYKNNSKATIEYYKVNLQMFAKYLSGEGITIIDDVDINVLRGYVLYLRSKPRHKNNTFFKPTTSETLASKSIQTYCRAIKCFFNYLYHEGYIHTDFSQLFKLPKATKKVIEILTDGEIKRILSYFNLEDGIDCRNYITVTLMIDSGLRLSELVRLEISDLYIEQSYIKVKGKGDKERIVPIGTYTQKAILKYLNFLRPEPALNSIKNLLLCNDGKPITKETIKSMVVRLSKTVDIPRLHPHLCRHTFSTRYLMGGGNLFTLQSILGHTSLEMVRNYSHLAASHATLKHKQLSPIDNIMFGK